MSDLDAQSGPSGDIGAMGALTGSPPRPHDKSLAGDSSNDTFAGFLANMGSAFTGGLVADAKGSHAGFMTDIMNCLFSTDPWEANRFRGILRPNPNTEKWQPNAGQRPLKDPATGPKPSSTPNLDALSSNTAAQKGVDELNKKFAVPGLSVGDLDLDDQRVQQSRAAKDADSRDANDTDATVPTRGEVAAGDQMAESSSLVPTLPQGTSPPPMLGAKPKLGGKNRDPGPDYGADGNPTDATNAARAAAIANSNRPTDSSGPRAAIGCIDGMTTPPKMYQWRSERDATVPFASLSPRRRAALEFSQLGRNFFDQTPSLTPDSISYSDDRHFNTTLARTLQYEGGKDDDPYDPGGRTAYGIIQKEYDRFRGANGLPQQDVWKINSTERDAIYKQNYWDKLGCKTYHPAVAATMFDYGVNSGNGRAVKDAQRCLGLPATGKLDNETQKAIAAADPKSFVTAMNQRRMQFLQGLNTFWRFGRGWTSRVNDQTQFSLNLIK